MIIAQYQLFNVIGIGRGCLSTDEAILGLLDLDGREAIKTTPGAGRIFCCTEAATIQFHKIKIKLRAWSPSNSGKFECLGYHLSPAFWPSTMAFSPEANIFSNKN